MDEMSHSMAALHVNRSSLEERLAVEKVCSTCHSINSMELLNTLQNVLPVYT